MPLLSAEAVNGVENVRVDLGLGEGLVDLEVHQLDRSGLRRGVIAGLGDALLAPAFPPSMIRPIPATIARMAMTMTPAPGRMITLVDAWECSVSWGCVTAHGKIRSRGIWDSD